jgi:hypothetical protein
MYSKFNFLQVERLYERNTITDVKTELNDTLDTTINPNVKTEQADSIVDIKPSTTLNKTNNIADDDLPVQKDDLIKGYLRLLLDNSYCFVVSGYKFGTTIVPFTTEDIEELKYKSDGKGFDIITFTKKENVIVFLHKLYDSILIVFRFDMKCSSAIAHAMYSLIPLIWYGFINLF